MLVVGKINLNYFEFVFSLWKETFLDVVIFREILCVCIDNLNYLLFLTKILRLDLSDSCLYVINLQYIS